MRLPLGFGAAAALLAVMAGAFGSHSLRGTLDARGLEVFQTAVTYQMYHAIALVLVALLALTSISRRLLAGAAVLFGAGIVLFSGSLYLLVLTDLRWIGPLTPLGGLCFMLAWVLIIVAAVRYPSVSEHG
ncbi:DUF423 domain-containing protein [Marinobacter sediminum]|uniref:DUF423 domain-containing protein n=1 Tax=Marinobacter sediminum TaxID=256323 RepID=UPI0019397DAF|nr:DUF423 domain-containing protein [Marinobacter sediminum]